MLGTSAREFSTNLIDIAVAVVLLLGVIVVAFGLVIGLGYYAVVAADSLWLVVSIVLGIGLGIILTVVLVCAVLAIRVIWQRHRHDLAPPAPQIVKVIEQAPPPAPLVLTSGLSPEQVVKIGGIDKRDLAWFTEQMVATKDWTAKRWEGVTLPNGFKITNKNTNGDASPTSYAQLIQLYVDCGAITDRSPGQTGKLAVTDADRIMTLLESHFKAQNKQT